VKKWTDLDALDMAAPIVPIVASPPVPHAMHLIMPNQIHGARDRPLDRQAWPVCRVDAPANGTTRDPSAVTCPDCKRGGLVAWVNHKIPSVTAELPQGLRLAQHDGWHGRVADALYAAFCQQWVAIAWAMLVGREGPVT